MNISYHEKDENLIINDAGIKRGPKIDSSYPMLELLEHEKELVIKVQDEFENDSVY